MPAQALPPRSLLGPAAAWMLLLCSCGGKSDEPGTLPGGPHAAQSPAGPGAPAALPGPRPTATRAHKAAPGPQTGGPESWPEANLDLAVLDLVRAFTPPDATATSDIRNAWQDRRRELIESLRGAPDPIGEGLLRHLVEHPEDTPLVRDGLLTGASYAAPEAAIPYLEEALGNYGGGRLKADLGLRGRAGELLAELAPERASTILESALSGKQTKQTWPRQEAMLDAYIIASQRLKQDPVPLLCDVATDLRAEISARNKAVKLLGEHDSDLGLLALETVLTESNGDAYVRRLAAQGLVKRLKPAEAAEKIEAVLNLEADAGMQVFLSAMLDQLARDIAAGR